MVTVSNASLDGKEVTISGSGYSLALGNDVTKSSTTNAGWSKLSSGKATYNFDSTTAGYLLVDNKVSYTKAVVPKSFTISGIKSTSGIKVDGSTVTTIDGGGSVVFDGVKSGDSFNINSTIHTLSGKKLKWLLKNF